MDIVKLLKILGPGASILDTGTGEERSALDLAATIEADPHAPIAEHEYTIANGYIYRMDGNDSLARKPFGQVVKHGEIPIDQLTELDVGGQLWRELKRLSGQN